MFGIFKPRTFFNLASNNIFWLRIIFIFSIIIGLSLALIFSPIDYLQKDTVRIMYVHVPSSWISLLIFLIIGISSFVSLIFRLKVFSVYAKCVAPIGLVFSLISLIPLSPHSVIVSNLVFVLNNRLHITLYLIQ